ncbi:MAG TPA: valine--tRNA ligase [Bacteroidia bacterium]|nr:valine--tRNA ligase [Bacteroidia bacterium]
MEIPKTYNPANIEDKWYQYWLEKKFFKSTPDQREPYTIVIPPPNVTGVLHMGHMLNNTIQDVLIRRARMQGKNACWVPGTDHASIATEAKVVNLLKEKGIKKSDLTREEFLKYAFEWKEKYGGIILEQLKKLGASCDWDRTRFTMEEDLSEAVIDVFIDLYNKGQIYRGVRMVNWDPAGMTAVSDEEVIHKETNAKLYYVNYKLVNEDGSFLPDNACITIATTRPETILGDTAVCVHPEDERYKHLKGKFALIPFVERKVPIIFDDYIDMEFGTGALKVTPAHDINDYNLGVKHKLEVIDTIAANGTMSEAARFYIGEDRFAVRKKIAKDLEEAGHIVKIEDIKNKVGYSERTDAVIEPKLSMQWFLKMDKISKPALDAVLNNEVNLIPEKFVNTYKHWMENVHDWCISRQLWWGQQIPAWYDNKGNFVVAKSHDEALEKYKSTFNDSSISKLRQDDDVVDTWFSSWLWPISVFDGFKDPDNADIKYYYPTNDLVTAPEILFFWVARMIIAGYEYRGQKPFTNVYLTGIVRDKLGRKMSKSLGNSPDPLDLIAKNGADAVRMGMLLTSPAGNDLPFDEILIEQGRNFNNKIWNAFRLIKGFEVEAHKIQPENSKLACAWFESRFNQQLAVINDLYSKYRMSEVLMTTYKLVWDDFCAWYLEMIKPDFVDGKSLPIDAITYNQTITYFGNLLKILHPFMPFITEELWHLIEDRTENDSIVIATWPKVGSVDEEILLSFANASEVIQQIRNLRNQKGISPKETWQLFTKDSAERNQNFDAIIKKTANINSIEIMHEKPTGAINFMVGTTEYFVPLSQSIDLNAEKIKYQTELNYLNGFLDSVNKKLSNEKFVANAKPEVIANERKKMEDAKTKIKLIEEQLNSL